MGKPRISKAAPATLQGDASGLPPVGGEVIPGEPVAVTIVAGEAPPDASPVTHLQIRALVDGFRRAGRAWSKHETVVAVEDFTPAQVESLLAEPHLVVLPMVIGMDPGSEV